MKKTLLILFVLPLLGVRAAGQPSPVEKPVMAAYFYKVKWGYQDEFVQLYRKNHYPVLKAQLETGRLLEVRAYTPRFHGEGRSDWTFMAVLVFKNWQAMGDNSGEQEIIKKLYPNQEEFRRQEQRRFELLEAHWDVPLNELTMD